METETTKTKPAAKKPAAKKPAAKVPAKPVVEEAANLSAIAEDINKVLKPEPPLDPKAKTLAEDIKELLPMVKKGDALSAPTWAALKAMGWSGDKKATATAKAATSKAPRAPKAPKEPKEKKLSRRAAVFLLIHEKGKNKAGILAEDLEKLSTDMMIKVNGRAGEHADRICKDTLAALVEFGAAEFLPNGACVLKG